MTRRFGFVVALAILAFAAGCKPAGNSGDTAAAPAATPKAITPADMTAMADAVPNTGPREGNNYKVFFLVLRQDQRPAAGFKIDLSVKGKGEKKTYVTNESGLATASDLPFPDAKHPLEAALHYYSAKGDETREITYPFIEGDAYRLKDTQYIPNTVTPEPMDAASGAPAAQAAPSAPATK